MPYVQAPDQDKCGFGSDFQKGVCKLSSVDKKYEQALWNALGKREARRGIFRV
jgi:hypothetical protein